MEFAGVEEVKDLQHDEDVEDESEMSGVDVGLFENSVVVRVAVHKGMSAASDSATHDAIVPLVIRMGGKDSGVQGVDVLRDELLTSEGQDENDCQLEDALTDDMLQHGLGNYVFFS